MQLQLLFQGVMGATIWSTCTEDVSHIQEQLYDSYDMYVFSLSISCNNVAFVTNEDSFNEPAKNVSLIE